MHNWEKIIENAAGMLAICSAAFAFSMSERAADSPHIYGSEFLGIYGRPSEAAHQRQIEVMSARYLRNGIDYSDVGAVVPKGAPPGDYRLVSTDGNIAEIWTPNGAVVKAMQGDVVGDAGTIKRIQREKGHWRVITSTRTISE